MKYDQQAVSSSYAIGVAIPIPVNTKLMLSSELLKRSLSKPFNHAEYVFKSGTIRERMQVFAPSKKSVGWGRSPADLGDVGRNLT